MGRFTHKRKQRPGRLADMVKKIMGRSSSEGKRAAGRKKQQKTDLEGKRTWARQKTVSIDGNCTQVLSGVAETGFREYAGWADQGARQEQQDRILAIQKGKRFLAAVFDGMGGMEGGALASETAAGVMEEMFQKKNTDDMRSFLKCFAEEADKKVSMIKKDGKWIEAGTTVAAIMLEGNSLYWLSAGDSRIYLCRRGKMICPVRDHNYRMFLDEMLSSGKIDMDRYKEESSSPKAEGLIMYLGMGGIDDLEMNDRPFRVLPGDRILLCSDGLYRSLPESKILEIAEAELPVSQKVSILVQAALEKGGYRQDNTSVILLEV